MNQQQNLQETSQKSIKYCIVQGHQKEIANHICILDKCDLSNKWICIKCALDDKHIHNQKNRAHIIDEDKFQQVLKSRQESNIKYNIEKTLKLDYFIKKLKDIVQDTNLVIQKLEHELKQQDQNKQILFVAEIINITEKDFSQISNEQIGQFVKDNNFFIGEIFTQIEKIKSDVDQNLGEQAIKVQQTSTNQTSQQAQKVPHRQLGVLPISQQPAIQAPKDN
ncbi:hypothetical protein pb186bvf_018325 [Paramecium bursaria]